MAEKKEKPDEKKQASTEEKTVPETVIDNTKELQAVKGQVLISGSEYWDFEENPVFIGSYIKDVIRDEGPDVGDLICYEFKEQNTGEEHIISNSHLITKSLEMKIIVGGKEQVVKEIDGAIMKFEFKGKRQNKDGQDVNVFRIELL